MHFGQYKYIFFALLVVLVFQGCKTEDSISFSFKSPDQGQSIKLGDEVTVSVDVPSSVSLKSIKYLLDNELLSEKKDAQALKVHTKDLKLGYRLLTAIIAYNDKTDTISTNIVLKSDITPVSIPYKVVNTFPHDTSAYTQGLSYVDGKLLESTGEKGFSALKWVDLASGKTLKQVKLEDQYFGEGSVKIGDKILMLTWQENIGFVFDANTFTQIGTFQYQNSREGWGLAFDGKQILKTDGTNRIWFLNKDTYKEESFLEVYDSNGEVRDLNEIEFINGKIYANVYQSNNIVIIDPNSGKVEAKIDLSNIVPKNFFKDDYEAQNNVLNGIAWDEKGKRLFVGGKKWPKLFHIELDLRGL